MRGVIASRSLRCFLHLGCERGQSVRPRAEALDLGGHAGLDFLLGYRPDGVVLTATAHPGDANPDAEVNVVDLGILAGNYGWSGAGGQPVPEPAAVSLIVLGGVALFRRRR